MFEVIVDERAYGIRSKLQTGTREKEKPSSISKAPVFSKASLKDEGKKKAISLIALESKNMNLFRM